MQNENIFIFFSVIFLTGFFIILPVYAESSFYLSTPNYFGPEEIISGILTIPSGYYSKIEKVELKIGSNIESETLYKLLNNCKNQECEKGSPYYSASGDLQSSYSGNDFLLAIPFPKDSVIMSSSLSFKLSPTTQPALEPEIDIGNEGIDWIYPGTPGQNYLDAQGITTTDVLDRENIITLNCEKLNIPKTTEIRLKAYVKASSKPDITVFNDNQEIIYSKECDSTPANQFEWLTCNLNAQDTDAKVFDKGDYYFCISSLAEDKIKYTTENELKQGYICSLEYGFSEKNRDYLINIQPKEHNSYLSSEKIISVSNQEDNSFLFKLYEYVDSCIYTNYNNEEHCIVPIKVKSKENDLTVSDLNLNVLAKDGEGIIINQFATTLHEEDEGIELLTSQQVDLSELNLEAPKKYQNYTLKAEFKSHEDTIEIEIIPKPIIIIDYENKKYALYEPITLSASSSYSPENLPLTYKWEFSDNTTLTAEAITKQFYTPGTYTITLKVTDTKQRTTEKILEITVTSSTRAPLSYEQVRAKFETAYNNYLSSQPQIKEIYQDLNLDIAMENSKATLDDYELRLKTPDPLTDITADSQRIAETTPEIITLQDSLTIKPFLIYDDITALYPSEKEENLITIQKINEKIENEYKARLVKIIYLTGTTESFVLIKKTFKTQTPMEQAFVIESIPANLATTSQITPITHPISIEPQILTYQFDDFTDEISIIYKLNSNSLALIPNIITLISPTQYPSELSIQLPAFDCPNGICNPGEDYLSCPEDCTCGNEKCDKDRGETSENCPRDCTNFPLTAFIVTIAIILVIGVLSIIAALKPGYLSSLKILQKITPLLHIKTPKLSSDELNKLNTFIKHAKIRGLTKKEISEALLKKGWKEKQVNYVLRRAK